jgi:tetratricopeptide (TPR) repeat protein
MEKWISAIREFYDGKTTEMLPSVIFGSGNELLQSLKLQQRVRIGMLPCVSAEEPHVAMGLMTLLSYLLERWAEVRVYRLFFQTDADPKTYQWGISDSQHGIDDWAFESLDENAVLSATLTKEGGVWRWTLGLQNDLAEEGDADKTWVYEGASLAELIGQLEKIASEIIGQFDVPAIIPIPVPATTADDVALIRVLRGVFEWQLHLLFVLYGKGWTEADIQKQLDELVVLGNLTRDDFGGWAVSYAVAHGLRGGYEPVPESLVTMLDNYISHFAPHTIYPSILVGRALFNAGHPQQAYDILEAETKEHPQNVHVWLIKADLYRRGGKLSQLIHAYQDAISRKAVNADLYQQYAGVLELLDENPTDTYALIDPNYDEDDGLAWEAIEAYEKALELNPDNLTCLQNQILLLMESYADDDSRLYRAFNRLLEKDTTGDYIRTVVDAAYSLDDPEALIDILEVHAEKHPKRADLQVSLAVLAMHIEEYDMVADYLQVAEELTDDEVILADIDRLMMTVNNPQFEERLGGIYAVVSGGNRLSAQDIRFLEETIEKAPLIPESYLYLAQAYIVWGEKEHALNTIKEGYAELPKNAEIAELLARYEWLYGDKDVAQTILTAGLSANPTYVPLMARMGQFLFERGEKDAARGWMTRAEALSPRDPILKDVRRFIADAMSKL